MEHLIADTGIQFIIREAEFNPSEPLKLPSGRILRYSFMESVDPFDNNRIHFDLLYNHTEENRWIPVKHLRDEGKLSLLPNGMEELDETGVPRIQDGVSSALFQSYGDDDDEIININNPESLRVNLPDSRERVSALEMLLDKWLPMPVFERDSVGTPLQVPMGWCRVMIRKLEAGAVKGSFRYQFIWAFDTHLSDDPLSLYSPYFFDENQTSKEYALCPRPDGLFEFLSVQEGKNQVSRYLASLLNLQPENIQHHRYKYIAYYIYLINFIRKLGVAPDITLYNPKPQTDVPVDLVLDIGNSRTCGVLFEDGDFTRSVMLSIRDLTSPWLTYNDPFDMRLVFRRADFGNDLLLPEDEFNWKSIVRIGREARTLVYQSVINPGIASRATSYSSPKRYLWDNKQSEERWEYLVKESDPFNIQQARNIFLKNFTDMFDANGTFLPDADSRNVFDVISQQMEDCHYSRSSLMTFVLVEVLQQAISQINSIEFRNRNGRIDCRRRLRDIIITCPTAMPREEQIKLRQSMADAVTAMRRCNPTIAEVNIIPSPESLRINTDDPDAFNHPNPARRPQWSFDEASACQLVYLYAELKERYNGEVKRFFDTKGHVRPEFAQEGYTDKSLTIGTIDIGAGTTDVMICSYKYEGDGNSVIQPVPHFYDSFYIAGDDILRNIVQRVVIEGPDTGLPDMGSIHSALAARLKNMSNDELRALACNNAQFTDVYRRRIDDITRTTSPERRDQQLRYLASILVRDFFGHDSAMMSFRDREARLDFNTQISVPIAQQMMDWLRRQLPKHVYTYQDIFAELQPSKHLLDHFAEHFGFRFEELSWKFDPDEIASMVRSTMEPLMKQLSILLYAYKCDILVLAGRPTSIEAIPDLFTKYFPLPPDRIIRLNDYRVGNWYPFADGQGYFYDQKSVVAVGAMVGHIASTKGFGGFMIDFKEMIRKMKSTANYIGFYNNANQQVGQPLLTPSASTATATVAMFPTFLGCKQFDSTLYQGRPLYSINSQNRNGTPLRITISRPEQDEREKIVIEEVYDTNGNQLPRSSVTLILQTLVDDGAHWLDKGEFELSLL